MSAALAVQKAIRARLVAEISVSSLVPPSNILDRNSRPAPRPAIIIGEDQEVEGNDIARLSQRVYSTIHVWKEETGLGGAKAIVGAIRKAIHSGKFAPLDGYDFADSRVSGTRYLRDPDGKSSHAVVTVETLVSEA